MKWEKKRIYVQNAIGLQKNELNLILFFLLGPLLATMISVWFRLPETSVIVTVKDCGQWRN